jgi:hypothetical protein
MNYAVSSTATTCTSGKVVPWGAVTTDRLQENALHAYYQGVMQTNGTLSYVDPAGVFVSSALTADEWSALWTYEAAFGIRTVSANTYPTSDFGLTYVGEDGNASSGTWTADGAAEFPYVNSAGSLPVKGAWTYRAQVDPASTTTVPLLKDAAGNALAVKHTVPSQGNREVLALTFESAGYLTHGQVLGYGLVNWVTRGLFLGERHAYLNAQPDDLFISDSVWSGPYATCANTPDDPRLPEYRMTGNDLTKVLAWQSAKRNAATTKDLTLEMPFNGEGTTDAYLAELGITNDTLVPVARRNQAQFAWVNHTWSHQNMDFLYVTDAVVSTTNGVSTLTSKAFNFSNAWGHAVGGTGIPAGTIVVNVTSPSTIELSQAATSNGPVPNATVGTTKAQATSQINRNNKLASRYGLTKYSIKNIIQPDISGLKNSFFLEAADEAGVRYVISDTSRTGDPSQYGVNEGRYNALRPSLLEVARYPVNLYFNASTPQEWLAQDNCLYPAGAPFGHVDTYEQLLDRESSVMLRYLIQGHNRPLMFHQPNLRAYDGTRSVLGDLIDATLAKYNSLVTVPILSPTQDALALKQIARQQYNDALRNGGLIGSIVPNTSVTLTANKEVTVPVTGKLAADTAHPSESYAGQTITYVRLLPGQSVTIPLQQ